MTKSDLITRTHAIHPHTNSLTHMYKPIIHTKPTHRDLYNKIPHAWPFSYPPLQQTTYVRNTQQNNSGNIENSWNLLFPSQLLFWSPVQDWLTHPLIYCPVPLSSHVLLALDSSSLNSFDIQSTHMKKRGKGSGSASTSESENRVRWGAGKVMCVCLCLVSFESDR